MRKRLGLGAARPRPRRRCAARTSSSSSSTCCCCAPAARWSRRGDQVADRRHRPSRQPPRALGRRAAGQPVQHRPGAHGAHHPRAHVAAGPGADHADDLVNARTISAVIQSFFGSIAAVAVHGPDQPAGRADAQAPPVGARARRPDPRPRRLRGARRPLHALRPHVPDRDAGRPEHRPDLLALDLRAGQRVRLPRDAVPPGARTASSTARGRVPGGRRGGPLPHRARRTRRSTRRRAALERDASPCATAASIPIGRRRTRSTTWTSRRSSWCRRRRRSSRSSSTTTPTAR